MTLARVSALGCLMLSAAAVPREGMMQPGANMSVLQLATAMPELSTFVYALKAANLTDALSARFFRSSPCLATVCARLHGRRAKNARRG